MKNVAELDKNMAVMTRVDDETLVWRSAREQPFRLEGLYDPYAPGPYRRLPQDVAEATSGGVAELALCTAGGRVRFQDRFALRGHTRRNEQRVPHGSHGVYRHIRLRPLRKA